MKNQLWVGLVWVDPGKYWAIHLGADTVEGPYHVSGVAETTVPITQGLADDVLEYVRACILGQNPYW